MEQAQLTGWLNRTHVGDCRALMRQMIADGVRVDCVVTSPPYWGLRDYGVPGQFGLERTWLRHVARMRGVFRLVRELLARHGTLWLNYGDGYASSGGPGWQGKNGQRADRRFTLTRNQVAFRDCRRSAQNGLKAKDLIGMPWRVALALQADGWYLRSEIIWHKPNPMPESVRDRPTTTHEHLFLLSRSRSYYYDGRAIAEPASPDSHARAARGHSGYAPPGQRSHEGWAARGINPKAKPVAGWQTRSGSHTAIEHAQAGKHGQKFPAAKGSQRRDPKFSRLGGRDYRRGKQNESFSAAVVDLVDTRNARTVWTIPTQPFLGAHFATFPERLVARCILAGSRLGDVIFDPFMGSGTVAAVATDLGRQFIGCELNPDYVELHELRRTTTGMPL